MNGDFPISWWHKALDVVRVRKELDDAMKLCRSRLDTYDANDMFFVIAGGRLSWVGLSTELFRLWITTDRRVRKRTNVIWDKSRDCGRTRAASALVRHESRRRVPGRLAVAKTAHQHRLGVAL